MDGASNWKGVAQAGEDRRFAIRLLVVITSIVLVGFTCELAMDFWLAVRKAHPALFHGGEYRALHADAGYEENVIAFSLGGRIVAVAPRLFARRLGDATAPIGGFWGGARLTLPEGEFEDVFTGARHTGGATPLSKLLAEFPVALLLRR